jgi:transcriptional regulator with XRE-family HTH domain
MQRILSALAKRMKELRKKRGYSQEAFADHAGLHRVAVGWIEQGKRVPSLKTLVKISQGFGISVSELLKGIDKGITKSQSRK